MVVARPFGSDVVVVGIFEFVSSVGVACFKPPQVMKVSSHHQPHSLPQVLVVFVCRAHILGRGRFPCALFTLSDIVAACAFFVCG